MLVGGGGGGWCLIFLKKCRARTRFKCPCLCAVRAGGGGGGGSVGGGSGGGGGGGLAVVMVCGSKKPTALQRVFHFAHVTGLSRCHALQAHMPHPPTPSRDKRPPRHSTRGGFSQVAQALNFTELRAVRRIQIERQCGGPSVVVRRAERGNATGPNGAVQRGGCGNVTGPCGAVRLGHVGQCDGAG